MRRIPLSRRSHVTGFQPASIGCVEHESALERDSVTLTLFDDADGGCAEHAQHEIATRFGILLTPSAVDSLYRRKLPAG